MKRTRIYISEFEAEERLRKEKTYSLPALSLFARRNELLLEGMDALTITMAEEGDTLVTCVPLPDSYLRWWGENFCRVTNISPAPVRNESGAEAGRRSVYQLLQNDASLHELLRENAVVNYAAVPEYYVMCQTLGLAVTEPDLSVVETLSRKSWAAALRNRLSIPPYSISVSSPREYDICVHEMLDRYGSVLIKDSMGVSGRGILPVDSVKAAERLSMHFQKQSEEGKTVFDFVIEQYLNKTMDFSCQLHIDRTGEISIDGYQKNTGKGFGYRSSCGLGENELKKILSSGYRDTVTEIAKTMAEAGYFGYACIDSMIADEDTVIPFLEINPRMSMGRFNLMLQKKTGKNCRLSYAEGTRIKEETSDTFLRDLEDLGLLYSKQHPSGIIPLAPAAWQRKECAGKRIRIYYAVVYDTKEEYEKLLDSWLAYCARCICAGAVA